MRKHLFICVSTLAMVACASQGLAQTVKDEVNAEPTEVIVTGSRLARTRATATSPLMVLTQRDLTLSGAMTIEDLLTTQPQYTSGQTSHSNNPGTGIAQLDLRGLGPNRNLVLVNGRRYVFTGEAQVTDINTIPAALVDRIEVVTGGSSAVYGSDAIAGVTNFILKDNFQGVDVRAQVRGDTKGSALSKSLDITLGRNFLDERANLVVSFDYYDREGITQGQRGFSSTVLTDGVDALGAPALMPSGSTSTPNGQFSGIPSGAALNTSANAGLKAALIAAGLGSITSTGFTYDQAGSAPRPFIDPADRYNTNPLNYLQIPASRFGVTAMFNYKLSDRLKLYSELNYYRVTTDIQSAEANLSGTYAIAINNPYVSAQISEVFKQLDLVETGAAKNDGYASIKIARRFSEVGPRQALTRNEALRFGFGIKGGLGDLSADFLRNNRIDAYYFFNQSDNSIELNNMFSRSRYAAGLVSASPGAAPLINPFGAGTISTQAADSIRINTKNPSYSRLHVASVNLTTDVVKLPAGNLSASLGYEVRAAFARSSNDPSLINGDAVGYGPYLSTRGSFNVKELFGEVRVPLLSKNPIFGTLTLNSGFRSSDYSLSGVKKVWTNLNGIEWSPTEDLTLRSQYQHAVRAPSIGELFGGQSGDRPRATDPCALPSANTDAKIKALCIATGVPEAYVGLASVQPDVRIDGILGGNPDLGVEKSDTKTFGFTYAPRFIPGLKLSVDSFDIKVSGAIAPMGYTLQNILNLCYTTIQDANSVVCGAIHRNPTNGVIASPYVVNEANANIGLLATKGIDLAVDYRLSLPFAVVGTQSTVFIASRSTWLDQFDVTPLRDFPAQVNPCAGAFGTTCREPRPEFKTNTRINWVNGPLTLSVNHRYQSRLTDDKILIPRRLGLTTGPSEFTMAAPYLAAKTYFDLSFNYDLGSRAVSIYGGVNNIFNTKPPIVGSSQQQANTYPSTYDVLGTEAFFGVRARF